jgi:nitroreductase
LNFLFDQRGNIALKLRQLATHLRSPLTSSPTIEFSTQAWAEKNVAFAAQNFMLAATAHGLVTAPMEGFDARRLCSTLQIPQDEFTIPLIVSVGYEEKKSSSKGKVRFELSDTCFQDKFGVRRNFSRKIPDS